MLYYFVFAFLLIIPFLKLTIGFSDGGSSISILGIKLAPNRKKRGEKSGKTKKSIEKKKLIKAVLKSVSKLSVDRLYLKYTVSDPDPYAAVTKYNLANLAEKTLSSAVAVKDKKTEISLDLESEESQLHYEVRLGIRIYRLAHIAIATDLFRKSTEQ